MRLLMVAAGVAVATQVAGAQQLELQVAGCYRLASDTLRLDAGRVLALDTVRLRLDTITLPRVHPDQPTVRRLSPDTLGGIFARPRDLYRPGWNASGDSVFIRWTHGFAFISAATVARRDSLIGHIVFGTDVPVSRLPTAPFRARRVACEP